MRFTASRLLVLIAWILFVLVGAVWVSRAPNPFLFAVLALILVCGVSLIGLLIAALPLRTRLPRPSAWATPRERLALAAVLSLGLVLRLPDLDESLWLDELWSTRLMLGNWPTLLNTINADIHPPLYYLLMSAWIALFGDSEISVRLPALLSGLLAIALAYLLTRRVLGWVPASLVALLMALSPVHIWYSQEARPYSFLLLAVISIIYCYYRLRDMPTSKGWLAAYALACFVAATTDHYAVTFVGVTWLLALIDRRGLLPKLLLASAPAVLTLGLYLGYQYQKRGTPQFGYLRPFTLHELWMLFFQWFTSGNALWTANQYGGPSVLLEQPPRLLLQIAFALLTLRGLIRLFTLPPYGRDVTVFLFTLPLLLLALGLAGFRGYIERGLFVLMPLYFLVLVSGVTSFAWRPAAIASWALAVGVSVAGLAGYMTHKDVWTVYKPNPDWRSMVRDLDAERRFHDLPALLYVATSARELTYYAPWMREVDSGGARRQPAVRGTGAKRVTEIRDAPRDSSACETAAQEGEAEFYLLRNQYWAGAFSALLERASLDPTCTLVSQRNYKGIELYQFRVSSIARQ